MTDLFAEPDDATPLAPTEREGLRQSWITLRRDLNAAEAANILHATQWARRRRMGIDGMLSTAFVVTLHRRMFGDVWAWAGEFRRTARNIGIDAYRIPTELAALLATRMGNPPFSWGGGGLTETGELRRRYVAALRAADAHDIGPLLAFARS